MNKLIRITCKYNELVDIGTLKDFQGSLKTLSKEGYEKLKLSIQKYGFTFPIFVWKHRGKYNIIDGHQRKNYEGNFSR
ncbi:MAG: hypothetical protein DDT23_00551 [candidate division WS2 bacterium]|nr:hypothetical protein [Candidatus Lithacetigena glycinireducens]